MPRRLFALLSLLAAFCLASTAIAQEREEEEEEDAPPAAAVEDEASEGDEEGDGEAEEEEDEDPINSGLLSAFKLRGIGPALMSGRIGDFAVNPDNRAHFFAAVSSGGVWETRNAGTTWKPVFDGQGSYSIGCVEMDPNDSEVIWVGTGENNSQRSVSFGDGVYKSTDGGRSWKNVGLKESEHIGMIAIDPRDSDVVYVAAQGPLWADGGDRGLYKTTDGGATWEKILEISDKTGVNEVHLDPRDPDVLYASSYQRRRHVWTLINGGPESGVWKSMDAGATWSKINRGLPGGDKGRIGLDISPVNPDVLYAIVEAAGGSGGLYRSTNRGRSWTKRSSYMTSSPQYYNEIICHPTDVDTVFMLDTIMHVTRDGGKTTDRMPRANRHVDDHALWIDPDDPRYMLVGCDGGVYESLDEGSNWRYMPNLPVTQFYRVAVDNSEPFYYIYGGTQDNNTLGGPSRTLSSVGITNAHWFTTMGGDGFETVVDPENPDIVYSQMQYGGLVRFDRRSGERIDIKPREKPGAAPYKWNWDSALRISPHDNERLYFGANILFRSNDRGNSWAPVSGDLTRQIDRDQLEVMGEVQKLEAVSRGRSTSFYGTLVALSESPIVEGLIYTGSDDGLVSVTEDGGSRWREAGVAEGVPELAYVSWLSASKHEPDRVYAAFDDKKSGNFAPMLFRSDDRGRTWTSIVGDLPDRNIVYVLGEDHVDPDLLFVGTEFGLFVTFDGGEKWLRLKSGLPTIAVRDLEIQERENDVVLGTFGRGFYVLDDYAPMRSLDGEQLESEEAIIFPTRDALAYVPSSYFGGSGRGSQGASFYAAPNPPFGAVFTYYVKEKPLTVKEERKKREKDRKKADEPYEFPTYEQLRAEDEDVAPRHLLVVRDDAGEVVRRLSASRSKGLHRTAWDLRWGGWGGRGGPSAVPGQYTVEFVREVDGAMTVLAGPEPFVVRSLDLATLPAADRKEVLAFHRDVGRLQRRISAATQVAGRLEERLDSARSTLDALPVGDDGLRGTLLELGRRHHAVMIEMRGDRTLSSRSNPAPSSISSHIGAAARSSWGTTSAPTQTHREQFRYAAERFETALAELKALEADVNAVEDRLLELGAPSVPDRLPAGR